MQKRDNLLFYKGDLHANLNDSIRQISEEVNKIQKEQFLSTSDNEIADHINSLFYITPLTIYEDSMEMEQHETKIDVSGYHDRNPFGDRGPILVQGIRVVVSIPFTGESFLWNMRPNSYQSVFPRADVRDTIGKQGGQIDLVFQQPSDALPEQLKQNLENDLSSIRFYINVQQVQIDEFNKSVPNTALRVIQARRTKLKKHDGITELLGIPLKVRDGVPSIEPIQMKRALVRPLLPPPKSGFKPEPGITDDDYEHILSVIRHEGRTFEITPKTYAVHDEEELRDIILAHLNGHYQGGATGETFRRNGKTDIRIEDKNRAAFVAECKIWRGQKDLLAAVNQLLGYLTWRDCKASILLFNKHNAGFSELLEKIPKILKEHPKFKCYLGGRGDGEWRFIFTSKEDNLRKIIINVSIFNIYVA